MSKIRSYKVSEVARKIGHHVLSRNARGHGIHSPYLYGFVNRVLNNPYPYYAFGECSKDNPLTPTNNILFRLVNEIQPKQILELNADASHSTEWMLKACHTAHCTSISSSTDLIPTNIVWDLVVCHPSNNHSKTIQNIEQILNKMPENSIFVWTNKNRQTELALGWKKMCQHPSVVVCIDLHFMGILFFKPELTKKKYRIRIKESNI